MKIERRTTAALATLALLAACGGGSGTAPAGAAHGARALASLELPGSRCPAGGARIDAGIDGNGNGLLDAAEIVSTQYVCDGTAGATGAVGLTGLAGAPGVAGVMGPAGLTALVHLSPEAAGVHCTQGGTKVSAGADANANGLLDAAEITALAYVCAAAEGAAGATGATGATGADGSPGATGADARDILLRMVAEGSSGACAAGGSRVESGLDLNRNGLLDAGEVTATARVCHGSNGAAGSNGASSLITVVAEPAGVLHCAAGGSRISSGLDGNGNGILDAGEVSSTAYVCNGADGTQGANGSNGTNGTNGSNGSTGATGATGAPGPIGVGQDGYTTLIQSLPEAAGANCLAGGVRILSGADTNRDGMLDDPAEVTATSYVCNGFGGWAEVLAATVQAQPDTGYVANSGSEVAITLPVSPVVGYVVRVSGAGAGGWRLAQNPGQSIVTSNLDVTTVAKTWTTRGYQGQFRAVASSADGSRLVAAAEYSSELIVSADAGLNWTVVGAPQDWTAVASSADGRFVVATVNGGPIFVSSDYGVTWSARAYAAAWTAVAASADGRVMVATAVFAQINVSTDYGTTWTPHGANHPWTAVTVSADGSRIAAAVNGGGIDISSDAGNTWNTFAGSQLWRSLASSADGRRLVAVAENAPIFTSDDFGVTWVPHEQARFWTAVTSSADGSRLVAASGTDPDGAMYTYGYLYASSDQGLTWTERNAPDAWRGLASSADGSRLAAVSALYGSGIISLSTPVRVDATTTGSAGWIAGRQYQAVELQHIGNGRFMVLDAIGAGFDAQ